MSIGLVSHSIVTGTGSENHEAHRGPPDRAASATVILELLVIPPLCSWENDPWITR